MSPKTRAPRRQPQRTCIVCRQTSDKRTLVRIVRTATGGVQIDERGKVPGRGAYLCDKASCWETALRNDVLHHALNTQLSAEARQLLAEYSKKFRVQHGMQTEGSGERTTG